MSHAEPVHTLQPAAGAANHHADGVEQMPPRIMADLGVERVVAQRGYERDQRRRGAGGGLQSVDGFGVRHVQQPVGWVECSETHQGP